MTSPCCARPRRSAGNDAVAVDAGKRAVVLGATDPDMLMALATALYRVGEFVECEKIAQQLITGRTDKTIRIVGLHAMARALAGQGRHVDAHPYAKEAARLGPNGELAAELIETMDRIVAQQEPPVRPSPERSMERTAWADLEAARFESLTSAITRPRGGSLAPRSPHVSSAPTTNPGSRSLPAHSTPRSRCSIARAGHDTSEAVLARIRALRIRDNAFIQIDPPPPLGVRYSPRTSSARTASATAARTARAPCLLRALTGPTTGRPRRRANAYFSARTGPRTGRRTSPT